MPSCPSCHMSKYFEQNKQNKFWQSIFELLYVLDNQPCIVSTRHRPCRVPCPHLMLNFIPLTRVCSLSLVWSLRRNVPQVPAVWNALTVKNLFNYFYFHPRPFSGLFVPLWSETPHTARPFCDWEDMRLITSHSKAVGIPVREKQGSFLLIVEIRVSCNVGFQIFSEF